nr:hypothetical protein BaRGS_011532 [Batillaria attramentaria]
MTSPMGYQTTENHPCSCPDSKPCLTDWTRQDHVITRQLRTASRILMTLSMLFCDTIQPQRQCRADEVAMQVSGLTLVPTEVNFVNCACSDGLPLVLHEQYHGSDHKLYMSYVCASFKDQCSRGWGYRRNCMEFDNESGRITYPCKCSSNRSCRPTSYNAPYRCLRD